MGGFTNFLPMGKRVYPADRYIVGIALKTTRLKLMNCSQIIYEGTMPAGTIHISSPSEKLSAQFHSACDFLHVHISRDFFRKHRGAIESDSSSRDRGQGILLRDAFAEQLAKILVGFGNSFDRALIRCVGQALAMHIARLKFPQTTANALPGWRLRRVEEYVDAHLDRQLSLRDLAKVAGLSRMHFAAQFRIVTGYRPREYILQKRIERAMSMLLNTEMPLVEIALSVGFSTQSHFSSVFRRIAGETPARWRYAHQDQIGG